jgi:hypothetical protein
VKLAAPLSFFRLIKRLLITIFCLVQSNIHPFF